MKNQEVKAIVIGVSAGGLKALKEIFCGLPAKFSTPIIVTQHLYPHDVSNMSNLLNETSLVKVIEAEDKMPIKENHIYLAPPNYHLLIERDYSFSLSTDEKVSFSRPSIDVMFESAAYVYKDSLVAVILTGANGDGAKGIKTIKKLGGYCIAQNPKTAAYPTMPQFSIDTGDIDKILTLKEIASFLFFKK